jgi:cell division protein FtsQ
LSATSIWHPSRGPFPGTAARPAVGLARAARTGRYRWVGGLVGLACLAAVTWWVTNSRVFDLRALRVSGNTHLSSAEVGRLADLTDGTNVLWTSAGQVERRLERHPWVLSADVSRTLPSTVVISVRERTPVAVIARRRPLLVAGDGKVLGRAGPSARLPRIDVPGSPVIGSRVSASLPQLTVARALPPDLANMVARVSVGAGRSVTLSLRDGTRVVFGQPVEARAKAVALAGVLSWAARNGLTPQYVDVRVPAAPALLP